HRHRRLRPSARAAARLFSWRVEEVLGAHSKCRTIIEVEHSSQDGRFGGTHVEANSRVVDGRFRREPSTTKRLAKRSRIQTVRSIWLDRKGSEQMSGRSERASELPLSLRQVARVFAPRLTPHAEII